MNGSKNILIGITSSIASYKIYELIRMYKKNDFNVKVVLTKNALNFVSPLILETLTNNKVYYEQFDPREDVEHISLVDWADIFVVAPISANTISKFALGIADNLLSSIFCAYLGTKKSILLAPAMNTNMYKNPIIQENLKKLNNFGCEIIDCEDGFLACGTVGQGRLASIDLIYMNSLRLLYQDKKNNSKKIIVTLGGTKEYIDNVRFISNSSSGKMGIALCDWAYKLGFEVLAVSSIEIDGKPYSVVKVDSAIEMLEKLKEQTFDYLIMASAVADFRVLKQNDKKISKENISSDKFNLELVKNPDVVSEISKNKKENQKIIGFCLADEDVINCAKNKLVKKNLDYIVANEVSVALNTNQNKVTIIEKSGKMFNIELNSKENIAKNILEVVCD